MATKKESDEQVKKLEIGHRWKTIRLEIEGISPLAMQNRPESTMDNLRRKDNGLPKRDYKSTDWRRFIDSIHWIDDNIKPDTLDDDITEEEYQEQFIKLVKESKDTGNPLFYIPSEALKESICIGAYRNGVVKNTKVARGLFMILGDKTPFTFDNVEMEVVPTINQNSPSRPMVMSVYSKFTNWKAELLISYNETFLSPDTLMAMIELAGKSVGVLARRLDKPFGKYGAFKVAKVTTGIATTM